MLMRLRVDTVENGLLFFGPQGGTKQQVTGKTPVRMKCIFYMPDFLYVHE